MASIEKVDSKLSRQRLSDTQALVRVDGPDRGSDRGAIILVVQKSLRFSKNLIRASFLEASFALLRPKKRSEQFLT